MKTIVQSVSASQTWPLRHEVMWPNEPLDYVKLPMDEQGLHFGLHVNEELTSVVSLFVDGDVAQFRKLATKVSEQGKGYASQLLSFLLDELGTKKLNKVWCNARTDKASFYHKFGLKETAHSFVKNGQSYIIMEKVL